jgi:hypothetical protein
LRFVVDAFGINPCGTSSLRELAQNRFAIL